MHIERYVLSLSTALVVGVAAALSPVAAVARDYGPDKSHGLHIIGLTADQRLIRFKEHHPGNARSIGYVSGLGGDARIIGIDFRVQDGKLYGVGDAGGVYAINPSNAHARKVSQLTVALSGHSFGVDFNPAADRLRVVSDDGQNLRHDVNPGGVTIVDGALNYTVGTTAMGVVGSAYTNNDLAPATATTLYGIDHALDQVVVQSPANAGSLAPTGLLGVDATKWVGFDIYSTVRNGVTVDIDGFASLRTAGGATRLYKVTLFTGRARSTGAFAAENAPIDIAIPLNQR